MQARKRQVLQTAMKLFSEKGFYDTSIQDIIDKANISKGTFYNYFQSKNDCLFAILEHSQAAAQMKRQELIYENNTTEESLFIEQIVAVMIMNEKHNLMPIFQSIFQSNDHTLHRVLLDYRFAEMDWVAGRFIDIHGEELEPYVIDLAIIFFGMIHHLSLAHRTIYKQWIDPRKNVLVAYEYTVSLIDTMKQRQDPFIKVADFKETFPLKVNEVVSDKDLLVQLDKLQQKLPVEEEERRELTTCLLDEINKETKRVAGIKALTFAFQKAFRHSEVESLATEITTDIYQYLQRLEK